MRSATCRGRTVARWGTVGLLVAILVVLVRGTRRQRRILRLVSGFGFRLDLPNPVDWVRGWFGNVQSAIADFVRAAIQVLIDNILGAFRVVLDAMSGLFWQAISGINSLADWVRTLAADLYNRMSGLFWQAVGIAQGWVADLTGRVISLFWDAVSRIGDALQWALQFARDRMNDAISWATNLFWQAMQAVGNALQTALQWAVDRMHDAIGWAVGLFNHVLSIITDLTGWIIQHVGDAILAVLSVVRDLIDTAVSAIYHALLALLQLAIDELKAGLSTVTDWIQNIGGPLLDVVESVLDWLIALATLPFSEAVDIWDAFRSALGHHVIDHKRDFMARTGNDAADHIARWVAS